MVEGIALSTGTASIGLVILQRYYARNGRVLLLAAAVTLVGSLAVAVVLMPRDAGVPVWLCVLGVVGATLTYRAARGGGQSPKPVRASSRRSKESAPRTRPFSASSWGLSFAVALVAAVIWFFALATILPVGDVERALFVTMMWPPLFAAFWVWLHASHRRGRAILILSGATAFAMIAAVVVWVS